MSEQTNEQIAARALETFDRDTDGRTQHPDYYDKQAAAVVKALADTGRLVAPGHVVVERGRWERVQRFALVTFAYFREGDQADKKLNWIGAVDAIEFGDIDDPVTR